MQERVYKTQAVVLRRYDFGETGRQLVIYTPCMGKLSAIAKGVKRPTSKLAGHLEPLCLSSIVAARGRNLDTITQASTVESFVHARTDPEKTVYAMLVAELLDKLTLEGEGSRQIWTLFTNSLRRIDAGEPVWPVVIFFWIRIMALTGYLPELQRCVECGGALDPDNLFFSPQAGGVLCSNCRATRSLASSVNASAIKVLRAAVAVDFETFRKIRVSNQLRDEVYKLLRSATAQISDREFSSLTLLDTYNLSAPRPSATT